MVLGVAVDKTYRSVGRYSTYHLMHHSFCWSDFHDIVPCRTQRHNHQPSKTEQNKYKYKEQYSWPVDIPKGLKLAIRAYT